MLICDSLIYRKGQLFPLQNGEIYAAGFPSSPENSYALSHPRDTTGDDDQLEHFLRSLEATREEFKPKDFDIYNEVSTPSPSSASSDTGPASVPEISNSSVNTPQRSPSSRRKGSDAENLPQGVRLPQRKGGMHLWQFLYAMLCDVENRYCNSRLIEWTINKLEFEFRLLEPEAIAIWWGHHKDKSNMSYDKLSRSLRYYYDKKIIRKISGERYVYRFCVDPEVMYDHIGNSNNRPQLKPMPQAAREAMSDLQAVAAVDESVTSSPSNKAARFIIAEDAEVLRPRKRASPSANLSEPSSSVTGCSFDFPSASSMVHTSSTSSYPCYETSSPNKRWSPAPVQASAYSTSCPTTAYDFTSLPTDNGFPSYLPFTFEQHPPQSLPPAYSTHLSCIQSVSPLPEPNQAYNCPPRCSPCEPPPFSSPTSVCMYSEALEDVHLTSDLLPSFAGTHSTSTIFSESANLLWPTLGSELDW